MDISKLFGHQKKPSSERKIQAELNQTIKDFDPRDYRRWVLSGGFWHWYGCGTYSYAACGIGPEPGMPLVCSTQDLNSDMNICADCKQKYQIKDV